MKDPRSVGDQVKSGFKITGLMLLSFGCFLGLVISLRIAAGHSQYGNAHRPLALLAAVALIIFIYQTSKHWARWLVGILALGLWRFWYGLMLKGFYEPPPNVKFVDMLVWAVYIAVAFALTIRHVRRAPKGAERIGLVCFLTCVTLAMACNSVQPLFYGLGLLASGEAVQRIPYHKRRRLHRAQGTPGSYGS